MKSRVTASIALLVALLSGCSGDLVKLAPLPPATYERLGHVEGTGCGTLGLVDPGWYVIPMGLGGRLERAWDYAWIGTLYCSKLVANAYPKLEPNTEPVVGP